MTEAEGFVNEDPSGGYYGYEWPMLWPPEALGSSDMGDKPRIQDFPFRDHDRELAERLASGEAVNSPLEVPGPALLPVTVGDRIKVELEDSVLRGEIVRHFGDAISVKLDDGTTEFVTAEKLADAEIEKVRPLLTLIGEGYL